MKKFKGELLLLAASIIWGTAFIFQKVGMDHIEPLTFNCLRYTLGALALLPVIGVFSQKKKRSSGKKVINFSDKTLLIGGLLPDISAFIF